MKIIKKRQMAMGRAKINNKRWTKNTKKEEEENQVYLRPNMITTIENQ